MMLKSTILLAGIAATPALGRTIHSVIVFNRHGDRTSKLYPNYQMTDLGAQQCYSSGSYYRDLYLNSSSPSQISGISPSDARFSQLWASAPDQPVLFQTALNFMQGLYPPFANESTAEGYQYVHIHGEGEEEPDTIWLKGDDACPAYNNASKTYTKSTQYQTTLNETRSFYEQFDDLLAPILGGSQNVTYKNAYNIFDLLNTASTQNESVTVDPSALDQTRYLANEWEWNHNFNSSLPDRSIGGESLAGGILRQMSTVVEGEAEIKFSLMTGSYDTFMAFFGLVGLQDVSADFMGLPNYAASMAFELFSEQDNATFGEDDLRVRFLFRNGTEDGVELESWPIFGSEDLGYGEFRERLGERAILSVGEWCERCDAEAEFCVAERVGAGNSAQAENDDRDDNSGLSLAGAGGIGAGVTLAVVAVVGMIAWMLLRKRKAPATPVVAEKSLSDAGSRSEKESV